MPHYLAASGARVQLDESPDDVGVRFGREDGPAVSQQAFRVLAGPAKARARGGTAPPVKRFGRFMMLHDAGASAAPVEAVVNALPRRLASRVARTMPVFVERESQLKLVATEQILVGFKPRASASTRRKLLDGLGLTLVGRSEFDPTRHFVLAPSVRRASRALDLANRLVEAEDVVAYAAPNFLAEVSKTLDQRSAICVAMASRQHRAGRRHGVAGRAGTRSVAANTRRRPFRRHCDHRRRNRSEPSGPREEPVAKPEAGRSRQAWP